MSLGFYSIDETAHELSKLYLASFLRAPELEGLVYWANKIINQGESFQDVGAIIFSLDIVKAIYPEDLSDLQFVEAIYNNVFGRDSDAEGLAYWANEISALRQKFELEDDMGSPAEYYQAKARGQLVMNMINAGLGTPDGTEGKQYIVNRLDMAEHGVGAQLVDEGYIQPDVLAGIMAQIDENTPDWLMTNIAMSHANDNDDTTHLMVETVEIDASGTLITLHFDQLAFAYGEVDESSFSFDTHPNVHVLSAESMYGNDEIHLTLDQSIQPGSDFVISYNKPEFQFGYEHVIQDMSGNDLENFSYFYDAM